MQKGILFSFLICFFVFKGVVGQYIVVGDTSSSTIIYKNIQDTVIGKGINSQGDWRDSVDIDFDNDKVFDVRFLRSWSVWSHIGQSMYEVRSLNSIEFDTIRLYPFYHYGYVDTIAYNSILNNNYGWFCPTGSMSLYLRAYVWNVPNYFSNSGVFIANNKYLGFRKILSNDTIYGWFLLDVSQNYPIGGLTIKSYAYSNLYNKSGNIFIYPNPSNDVIYIETQESIDQTTKINITNCLGEDVHSDIEVQSNQKIKLNVSNLANGIYFIEYQNQNARLRKKMIISR